MKKEHIPIPKRTGDYINIYKPQADIYKGVDTQNYRNGKLYERWIPNDFSILRDGGTWHMVGITHPEPSDFHDAYDYKPETIHEAEYQLFHCEAKSERFADLLRDGSFTDRDKILYPYERPDERPEIWAPSLIKRGEEFVVVYSPRSIRAAASTSFSSWKRRVLFECDFPWARDPFVYFEDGVYSLIYCDRQGLSMRTSRDFQNWSNAKNIYEIPFADASCESPFLFKRGGYYYLLWCIYDGRNGSYDERTFVFAAPSLDEFSGIAPLTVLDAHAPEVVCDGDDYYLLSVFYPDNGVSAAKIEWE